MASEKQTAAIVGAGTIGLSWATLFAAHGLRVRISDPRPDLEDVVRATVRELSATLPGAAQDPEALLQLITVEPTSRPRSRTPTSSRRTVRRTSSSSASCSPGSSGPPRRTP
jgi:2-polyprenyl-6-methoxyphenol hydroxylase-like FAD-dependent oxidoreductase